MAKAPTKTKGKKKNRRPRKIIVPDTVDRSIGKPRVFATPDDLAAAIAMYVEDCREKERPVTVTGMIFAIGLSSRESFDEYGRREGYSDIVKRAKLFVQSEYELRLNGTTPTGPIFALKNMGWSDKQEISGPDGGPLKIAAVRLTFED